jgi:hypothetical protein
MKKLEFSLIFSLLFFGISFTGLAQESKSLSITNPGELFSTYNIGEAEKTIIVKAVGIDKFNAINQACHESEWPTGISNLNSRGERLDQMKQYSIIMVTTLDDKCIIEIRPEDNRSMPKDMQSDKSFYFIMNASGLNLPGNEVAVAEPESEAEFYDATFPQMLIIDPSAILANHVFTEEEQQDIENQLGEEGYGYILDNCKEIKWPAGINSQQKRLKAEAEFLEYNAFLVAETGDISILEITPEENTQMTGDFLPVETFYIVIKSEGTEYIDF